MFSFSASETILGEFNKTRYTYFDQEEKKVLSNAVHLNTPIFGPARSEGVVPSQHYLTVGLGAPFVSTPTSTRRKKCCDLPITNVALQHVSLWGYVTL